MAYEKQTHCVECGISIPDVHEDADKSALLCDTCYGRDEAIEDVFLHNACHASSPPPNYHIPTEGGRRFVVGVKNKGEA